MVISTHSLTHYPRKSQLWASAQKRKSWTAVLRKHWLSTQGTNIRSSNSIISVGFSCWFVVVACLFFSPSLVIESDMSATEYSNIQSTATKTSSKPERCRFVQRPRKRQRWFSRTNSDKVFFLFFFIFKKKVYTETHQPFITSTETLTLGSQAASVTSTNIIVESNTCYEHYTRSLRVQGWTKPCSICRLRLPFEKEIYTSYSRPLLSGFSTKLYIKIKKLKQSPHTHIHCATNFNWTEQNNTTRSPYLTT